jgi:hypothetical protein
VPRLIGGGGGVVARCQALSRSFGREGDEGEWPSPVEQVVEKIEVNP